MHHFWYIPYKNMERENSGKRFQFSRWTLFSRYFPIACKGIIYSVFFIQRSNTIIATCNKFEEDKLGRLFFIPEVTLLSLSSNVFIKELYYYMPYKTWYRSKPVFLHIPFNSVNPLLLYKEIKSSHNCMVQIYAHYTHKQIYFLKVINTHRTPL